MHRDSVARILILLALLLLVLSPLSMVRYASGLPVNYGVSISKVSFKPSTISIHAGNTVTWTNNDPLIYELYFSDSHGNTFALSPYLTPGAAYTLSFPLAPHVSCTYQYLTIESTATIIGSVKVLTQGDVNGDGIVNIVDLATVGAHFGTVTGDPNYLPAADLDNSGNINIVDLVLVAAHFGDTATPC